LHLASNRIHEIAVNGGLISAIYGGLKAFRSGGKTWNPCSSLKMDWKTCFNLLAAVC